LRIPGFERPWESYGGGEAAGGGDAGKRVQVSGASGGIGKPDRIASALDIMIDGPIGAAAFNNEFGRPAIAGYFRTFELAAPGDGANRVRGYHKPIMIAGGLGNVRRSQVQKG